jgi:hypothetical protein
MRVTQRTTTRVPGSQRSLHLTIDDITAGQVMASLAGNDGKPVLAATSLKRGESAAFTLGDATYQLTLKELDNSVLGDDFATFVISSAAGDNPEDEREKIEQLLAAVAADSDAVFIRNGAEQVPQEAADHLRAKWKAAGDRVKDVESFIDKIATKSSMSNEPYRVRKADGTEVAAADYLREIAKVIESKR